MASPHSTGKHIERDFEIARPVFPRGREPPAANIDLQCRQNELRHRQGPVALLAEIDEPILRLPRTSSTFTATTVSGDAERPLPDARRDVPLPPVVWQAPGQRAPAR